MDDKRTSMQETFDTFPAPVERVRAYTDRYRRHVEAKGHLLFRLLFFPLLFLARMLTFDGAYRLGKWVGLFLYRAGLRRSVALTNLDIAFGDGKSAAEKEKIYRDSLVNFGRVIVKWLRLPFKGESFWRESVRFTNEDLLRRLMNRKKGVVLLGGHIGMWDLVGGKIGMSGYPFSIVARRIKNSFLDKWSIDTRCRMNAGSIRNRKSMDRIKEGLLRGEAVAMALDQSMQLKQGVFIDWMGRPACSVRSASYIAKTTGAPVVVAYMLQHGPKEFEAVCREEVTYEPHADPERELTINTQKQSDAVQRIILERPEQWFWIHKRWKVQPEGVPDPYR